nr:hypothetical protein [Tanacetum cinerariifolium]
MTDNRTMAEMLRAPTEGCAEAIVVPLIFAEQFDLKHSLINIMTSEQFFGLKSARSRAARRWLEKEPPCLITTWDDLLDTFYNALNPADQDSLNVAAGGNLLEKSPQDTLTIIENKSKVRNSRSKLIASPVNACDNHSSYELAKLTHAVNQRTRAVTTAMTAMLKQFQSNPPPAEVKAVEEICVTCGGAHPYYQCLAASGNTFPEYRDNIQGSGTLPGNTVANPKLKAITTRSGLVTEGPTVPNPPKSINPEEDECVEETYTNPDLTEYTIKVPPPLVQKPKPPIQRNFVLHTRDSLPPQISDPRVPLILGRPFLRAARALIDVHGEEMILLDGDESEDCLDVLVSHKQSGNPTFSLYKEIASPKVTHEIHDLKGCTFLSEELPDIDYFNDIYSHFDDDPLSSSTTYSATSLLEEFADELALISYPPDYDDTLTCDIESDIRKIEFLLYQGEDSDFKDSIDQSIFANRDDLFVDPTPEMFTDEQPPDYSFSPKFNVYPDDFLEIESDANNFDDDLFPRMMICPHLIMRTSIPGFMKILANGFYYLKSSFSPLFRLGITSVSPDTSLCEVSKAWSLSREVGMCRDEVATWDDLAFKIMPFGLNVKH